MKRTLAIIALGGLIGFSACKKDNPDNNNNTTGNTTGQTTGNTTRDSTNLIIKVRLDDDTKNPVAGADVTLFQTYNDYIARRPILRQAVTNEAGEVKFIQLQSIKYYIRAEDKDGRNNNVTINSTDKLPEEKTTTLEIPIKKN